jgi:hypothetical protein
MLDRMRLALVIAATGALALGLAVARWGGGEPATAAEAPLQVRVSQLEDRVSGICTAFRTFNVRRSYHDFDASFHTLVRNLQTACGAARRARPHEDSVKPAKPRPRKRHEDRPPPPPPPHEG